MKSQEAKEKLRVIDIIKENASLVLAVAGFIWIIFQYVITPINRLQYDVGDILNNHLKTIQDGMTTATAEREEQGKQLSTLSEQIIRLQTIIEKQ